MNRTKQKLGVGLLSAAVALIAFSLEKADAQILASTARQSSSGSLKILAYYEGVSDQSLNFSLNGSGSCATPTGVSFACGQSGNVEAKGNGGAGILKLVWQPWERFQYYALYGVGEYSLSAPSSTVTNSLTGDSRGQIYGLGVKASIVPDTLVAMDGFIAPAIALDVSMTRSVYNFNRVAPADSSRNGSIDQRLELMTYQFALESSHVFSVDEQIKLEPYGGVKWVRVQSDLKDLGDGSHAGGQTDTVTPFIGLRLPAGDHEAFFAEASFIDGYHYGAGLDLRFK